MTIKQLLVSIPVGNLIELKPVFTTIDGDSKEMAE